METPNLTESNDSFELKCKKWPHEIGFNVFREKNLLEHPQGSVKNKKNKGKNVQISKFLDKMDKIIHKKNSNDVPKFKSTSITIGKKDNQTSSKGSKPRIVRKSMKSITQKKENKASTSVKCIGLDSNMESNNVSEEEEFLYDNHVEPFTRTPVSPEKTPAPRKKRKPITYLEEEISQPDVSPLPSKTCYSETRALSVVSSTMNDLNSVFSKKNNKKSIPVSVKDGIFQALNRLISKLSQLEEENDILKKRISIFESQDIIQSRKASNVSETLGKANITTKTLHMSKPMDPVAINTNNSDFSPKNNYVSYANVLTKGVESSKNKAYSSPNNRKGLQTSTTLPTSSKRKNDKLTTVTQEFKTSNNVDPNTSTNDNDRTFFVIGENMLSEIKSKIKLSSLNIEIKVFRETKNKEVLIKTNTKEESIKLLAVIKHNFPQCSIRRPSFLLPRIEVSGLSNSLKEEEIIPILRISNKQLFENHEASLIRCYKNEKSTTAIIECSGKLFSNLIQKQRIKAEWDSVRVKESINILRCFSCLQYGHKKEECSQKKICYKCTSTEHAAKECPSSIKICINCKNHNLKTKTMIDINHSCYDENKCTLLIKKIRAEKKRINYSSSNIPNAVIVKGKLDNFSVREKTTSDKQTMEVNTPMDTLSPTIPTSEESSDGLKC
jgi:hypothetical protein